jgi:hypothetical protein
MRDTKDIQRIPVLDEIMEDDNELLALVMLKRFLEE